MSATKTTQTVSPQASRVAGAMIGSVGLILALLAAFAFLRIFSPPVYEPVVPPFAGYDAAPMHEALGAEPLDRELAAVVAFGPRFMGEPGGEQTCDYIRSAYAAAGLEIVELAGEAPAPATQVRRIADDRGNPLPGVDIYPFFPNTYQPMVTPPEGLTGKLVASSLDLEKRYHDLKDAIMVIDLADQRARAEWHRFAHAGVRAVVLTHAEGLDQLPWVRGDVMAFSGGFNLMNMVRLAASPEILNHVGETVTLTVRTQWRNTPHRTLVGRLRAPEATSEALVVPVAYDAFSLLPDHAHGDQGALAVAMHLQLLRGLAGYAETLRRDIYFVAAGGRMSASAGERTLLQFIGPMIERREVAALWETEAAENQAQAEQVGRVYDALKPEAVLKDPERAAAVVAALSADDRAFLRQQVRYAINTLALEKHEEVIRRKAVFDREGGGNIQSESFKRFFAAQEVYNEVQAKAGDPLPQLLSRTANRESFMERYAIAAALRQRFDALQDFHRRKQERIGSGLRISKWFMPYRQIIALDPRLIPVPETKPELRETENGKESLTFLTGWPVAGRNDARFADLLRMTLFRLPADRRPDVVTVTGQPGEQDNKYRSSLGIPFQGKSGSDLWTTFGYAGFTLANAGRKVCYDDIISPFPMPLQGSLETLADSLAFCAETVLTLAHGNGRFDLPKKVELKNIDFTGTVYASGVGRSIVPNYPMADALVGVRSSAIGRILAPMTFTDVYGRYAFRLTPLSPINSLWAPYSPIAVRYGDDGRIAYIKDVGAKGQRIYTSENVAVIARSLGGRDIHIVVFRADPITILDMINPQTLRGFADADAWRKSNLQPFDSIFKWREDAFTLFVPPNERLYLIFKAGAPDNEALLTVRAFALGESPDYVKNADSEIDGPGFLPSETPVVTDMPLHAARSMTRLNDQRLDLQIRSGMADELTLDFHQRSVDRLQELRDRVLSLRDRLLTAREALTYAILNHPVVRNNVVEAVIGIVWYIGLLVPFVIFSEKLIFCFSDIRKQLLTHLVVFLVVFGLLRVLHPAFHMIRSSLMILLGFIIFLISTLVTLMISGRFKENLDEIRQKQAKIKGTEVNSAGVLATAFMLGLNNMHRRKVRTGLTCATLVLLTFVMISFTSVQSNVVARSTAVGRASYQGILVKNEDFEPIAPSEMAALGSKYAHRYVLSQRLAYFGVLSGTQQKFYPEIRISNLSDDRPEGRRQRLFKSCLMFEPDEPLADHIRMLTHRRWFSREQLESDPSTPIPIMLPSEGAEELRIRPEQVDEGGVFVMVNGARCEVIGIFDSQSLANLRDLDGLSLLPFDIMALQTIRFVGDGVVLADPDSPLIGADQVILSLHGAFQGQVLVRGAQPRLCSVAIEMPPGPYQTVYDELIEGNSYRETREAVDAYLEQSGRPAYYGLDRFAYYGRRMRERSLGGLIDMLIPLIIAALTVVNTMRGSVYERRDEIFVYNAVGIAPRYVFFMFFAEAFVYSVMGSVLGYILSQGTGKVLTALNWTGGLNMNFTSLSTVYASLTIVGAVFLSTWFPARSAMEIAAPAEDSGWDLPEPEGDRLRFKLPFTFDRHDRVAVLGFFARYLSDHGEGSSGPFFAGTPALGVSDEPDEHAGGGAVPQVSATIWLKPFDLGVSQRMTIRIPTDAETGEFVAEIMLERLSGTVDAWNRLCRGFTARVRRHFLHWRAVGPDLKKTLYREAAEWLRAAES